MNAYQKKIEAVISVIAWVPPGQTCEEYATSILNALGITPENPDGNSFVDKNINPNKNSINLNTCVPGQKLRSKHGIILTYLKKDSSCRYPHYPHYVTYPEGGFGTRTDDGFVVHTKSSRLSIDHDIVEILPLEKYMTKLVLVKMTSTDGKHWLTELTRRLTALPVLNQTLGYRFNIEMPKLEVEEVDGNGMNTNKRLKTYAYYLVFSKELQNRERMFWETFILGFLTCFLPDNEIKD